MMLGIIRELELKEVDICIPKMNLNFLMLKLQSINEFKPFMDS